MESYRKFVHIYSVISKRLEKYDVESPPFDFYGASR